MTPEELKAWRLSHRLLGNNRPLSQSDCAAICNLSCYQTWNRWENGVHAVPAWLPAYLRLVSVYNGNRAEISPRTMSFVAEA